MIKNINRQRGVTLFEILIVLVILGIVAIVVWSFFGGATPEEILDHCKQQANDYAASTGRGVRHVSCMSQDTNWDEYVTATIFFDDETQLTLDCALPGNFGCKRAEKKIVHNLGIF